MRFFATKERRILREEFVYKYCGEVGELIAEWDTNCPTWKEKVKTFIEGTVRKELEYSCRTNWLDIFIFLKRTFEKLF